MPDPSELQPDRSVRGRSLLLRAAAVWILSLTLAAPVLASSTEGTFQPTLIEVRIPVEFLLFGLTLLGVAVFHRYTLLVALTGLSVIVGFKVLFTGFHTGPGWLGLLGHLGHEWVLLTNLLGLLLGFALLARHFEDSQVPHLLPRLMPAGWPGGFVLLALIFVLSAFLDNIAAALIGGTVAAGVFRYRVHIGYLAAIVAASNAGGSGSVVGDTTTTMMWISGIAPSEVVDAYVAAVVALVVFGIPAAMQQHRHSPMVRDVAVGIRVDWARLGIVAAILITAVIANILMNFYFKAAAESLPLLGLAVWAAIFATARVRRPEWSLLPEAVKGSAFLLSLVICASMMPVEQLPPASWLSAIALGFVSAVFDNIPLTALALKQGGFDWGVLAFAVGFGGSMLWFGSSAGVALANLFPEAKSAGAWLRDGWHVPVGYVAGMAVLLLTLGWNPHETGNEPAPGAPSTHTGSTTTVTPAPAATTILGEAHRC